MYELIQLTENDYYIDCPAKIGLVRTGPDEAVLIDSGNDKDAAKKILKHLDQNQWHLKALLLTHSNADHSGGACYLKERTSCPVYASDKECDFIRHPEKQVHFEQLLVSPHNMLQQLFTRIDTEIANARAGRKAYILGKINHITDERIVRKLYEASEAGVEIRMLVRGNCSVIPGVAGQSENIELRGIIDRYLEHSRIIIFCNGGHERYYLGSADWMTRNFNRRVEVYVPVHDRTIRAELRRVVEYGLRDNMAARVIDGTDSNRIYQNGETPFRSQKELYEYYTGLSQNETKQ